MLEIWATDNNTLQEMKVLTISTKIPPMVLGGLLNVVNDNMCNAKVRPGTNQKDELQKIYDSIQALGLYNG